MPFPKKKEPDMTPDREVIGEVTLKVRFETQTGHEDAGNVPDEATFADAIQKAALEIWPHVVTVVESV
jgi:hypothetical protein